ncbi:hypothetical protein ACLKA6_007221 [Drosophila palustris]
MLMLMLMPRGSTCNSGSSSSNSAAAAAAATATAADAHKMVHHNNDDAMNKIPLKSASGLDDEEKNGGELMQDTAAAEEARREQMRVNILAWMKKLTIGLICFIGIALISYVIISLCFSELRNMQQQLRRQHRQQQQHHQQQQQQQQISTPLRVSIHRPPSALIYNNILARNGSAVDATIAVLLCNGLHSRTVENFGIGGGLMMNIYERATRHSYIVDASPADSIAFDPHPEHLMRVPGEVMGYHVAHQRFGKLPWRELVEPSLRICQTGYSMSNHQEFDKSQMWDKHLDILYPVSLKPFEAPKQLCNTFQLLADNGPMDFYNGTVAKLLAEDLKELGSVMTQDDLNAYKAKMRLSVQMPLGKDTLYSVPPERSLSVVSHVLSILEGFNLTRADLADDKSHALTLHRISEAIKFGAGRRSDLQDPQFNEVCELARQLNNPEYAAQQRAKINDSHVLKTEEYGNSFNVADQYSSSGISVIAPNGDAVSATSLIKPTLNGLHRVIGPRTGISLNAFRRYEQNWRPLISQAPILLADHEGNIRLVAAVAGESDTVQVIARILWFDEDIKTAVNTPRFSSSKRTDAFYYEERLMPESMVPLFKERGISPMRYRFRKHSACGIERNATAIYASAMHRTGVGVAGF